MRTPLNRSGSQGATIIEFAFVAPLFFFLVFATIEFGRYFFVQHTVQYATREGTRLALVGLHPDIDGKPMTREATIIKKIRDSADIAVKPDELQISIYPVGADYTDPTGWETTVNAGQGGDYMRVRVQYKYYFMMPFIKGFFPTGVTVITASALYRNELF
ncbi:TadE family protein [uncultured Thiodictyon sp.]|jgi:hypothetical protein|uniref:TadE/TadG family type IV pilus assembly protein n=1 Tax=uncultured Thiodictyon sp. TaxID=1846217 RepID=UPI0025E8A96F|nr:TadE family protein [uncultured Thiodictyon sp.]